MPKRDSFLLRLDPKLLAAVRRWAGDELRSVNGQFEYILRRALADAGRLPPTKTPPAPRETKSAADVAKDRADSTDSRGTASRKK